MALKNMEERLIMEVWLLYLGYGGMVLAVAHVIGYFPFLSFH